MSTWMLVIREPDRAPREIELEQAVSVGRDLANDVVLADERMGRVQFRVLSEGGVLWVENHGKTNPTEVNGRALEHGERQQLRSGSMLRTGPVVFELRGPGDPEATVANPTPRPEGGDDEPELTVQGSPPLPPQMAPDAPERTVAGPPPKPRDPDSDAGESERTLAGPPPRPQQDADDPDVTLAGPAPGIGAGPSARDDEPPSPEPTLRGAPPLPPQPEEPQRDADRTIPSPAPGAGPTPGHPPGPEGGEAGRTIPTPPPRPEPASGGDPEVTEPAPAPGAEPTPGHPPGPEGGEAGRTIPTPPPRPEPKPSAVQQAEEPSGGGKTVVRPRGASDPGRAAALARLRPTLILKTGLTARRFTLTEPVTSVGRNEGCNVRIEDETVSRQHARIEFDGEKLVLTDIGSAGGTAVDGGVLAAQESAPLGSHSLVRFGDVEGVFLACAPGEEPAERTRQVRAARRLVRERRLSRDLCRAAVRKALGRDQAVAEVLLRETEITPREWSAAARAAHRPRWVLPVAVVLLAVVVAGLWLAGVIPLS